MIEILENCNTMSITVVKLKVNIGSGDDNRCFEIKVIMDTGKFMFMNIKIGRFREI